MTVGFTRAELFELWTAIQQYIDNHPDEEAPAVPAAAESARDKLDALFAEAAVAS